MVPVPPRVVPHVRLLIAWDRIGADLLVQFQQVHPIQSRVARASTVQLGHISIVMFSMMNCHGPVVGEEAQGMDW